MFTLSLKALQVQLTHLFEGVGGKDSIQLLELLGGVSAEKQKKLLAHFQRMTKEALLEEEGERTTRSPSAENRDETHFIQTLTSSLFRDIEQSGLYQTSGTSLSRPEVSRKELLAGPGSKSKKASFLVLDGGKTLS